VRRSARQIPAVSRQGAYPAYPVQGSRTILSQSFSGASALWCRFGVISPEGMQIAEDGGLTVVADRCIKIEHAPYAGRMHWLGFNTQRITSVRTGLQ